MPDSGDALRILVIDDNPAIHEDFRKILDFDQSEHELDRVEAELFQNPSASERRLRFDVETAAQGEEGLRKVRAAQAEGRPFAIAFVDLRMPPGWDGVETTTHLWRESPDLQVVLCSAYSDYTWQSMVRKFGVSDRLLILKKPFDQIEVLQLAHALARKWLLSREVRGQLESLEARIAIRTAELQRSNAQLRNEVTERNAALEALRAAESRFELAFHANPMAMLIEALDDGRFVEINAAGLALLGRSRDEIVGRTAEEISLWPDLARQAEVRLLLRAGEPVRHVDCQVRDGQGRLRQARLWGERFDWRGSDHLLFIAEDLTEIATLEHQLRHAQKMEAVGSLAAGVAHEFNNVLAVIQGHLTLQLGHRVLAPDTRASLEAAFTASERAAALTRRLLSSTRQQVIGRDPLDLAAVLADSRALLTRTLGEQIEQRWELGIAHPIVIGEAGAIEQIVLNLALNARDAMPAGGMLTLRLSPVEIDASALARHPQARPGQYARLSVIDTGSGMSAETMQRAFEPFFSTKDPGKGTGLGLAVVYGIVEKLGGWIEVESSPGAGSSFHVYLPATTEAPAIRESAPPVTSVASNQTILVVEDEEFLIYLLQGILGTSGYSVLTAADGPSALRIWAEHSAEIDLVLTDMVMPGGISGRALAALLQKDAPHLRIIYTSGYSPEFAGGDITLTPGVNFLPKPYTTRAVLEIVQHALRPRGD